MNITCVQSLVINTCIEAAIFKVLFWSLLIFCPALGRPKAGRNVISIGRPIEILSTDSKNTFYQFKSQVDTILKF